MLLHRLLCRLPSSSSTLVNLQMPSRHIASFLSPCLQSHLQHTLGKQTQTVLIRYFGNRNARTGSRTGSAEARRDTMYYGMSMGMFAIALTFAAIPAYRVFCEMTSFGGTTQVAKDFDKIQRMNKVEDRLIRVTFMADRGASMQWDFRPLQNEVFVHPGETALVFYTAKNPTDKPIIGISSYQLSPFEAAYYFNKIQCFCFEEQILSPGEQVDLPVFFYIDPEYADDPALERMDSVLLSYTFFDTKSNVKLPSPFDRPKDEKL